MAAISGAAARAGARQARVARATAVRQLASPATLRPKDRPRMTNVLSSVKLDVWGLIRCTKHYVALWLIAIDVDSQRYSPCRALAEAGLARRKHAGHWKHWKHSSADDQQIHPATALQRHWRRAGSSMTPNFVQLVRDLDLSEGISPVTSCLPVLLQSTREA